MRGKVEEEETIDDDEGITPAYAGKSPNLSEIFINYEDHPRLCGEK